MRIRNMVSIIAAVLIIALCGAITFAQPAANPPEGQVSPKASAGKEPSGGTAGNMPAEEPQRSFRTATEEFLKKNRKAAGNDIRRASEFMKAEASRATGEGKEAIRTSAKELDKLADDVEKGAVTSEQKLHDAFARAHLALAKQKNLQASEAWTKKETKATGEALKSSANHMENAMSEAGQKANEAGKTAVKDTRVVSGKLIEGYGWVHEEVGKVITDGGEAIAKLGKSLEPSKQ